MTPSPLSERLDSIYKDFYDEFVNADVNDYGKDITNGMGYEIYSFYRSAITQLVSDMIEGISEEIEGLDVYWTRDACVKKSDIQSILKKAKENK